VLVAVLLAHLLVSGYSGQRYDSRERFSVPPTSVHVNERVMRGRVTNRVVPPCPKTASQEGIEGKITLSLNVDEKGRVATAEMIFGKPIFQNVAVQAGRRLRFRPYYLNGEAVPMTGRITYVLNCRRD